MSDREALQQLIQEMRAFPVTVTMNNSSCVRLKLCLVEPAVLLEWADRLALLADVLGSPRPEKDKKDQETRVDHTQYDQPLATAASNQPVPTVERLFWLAEKVQAQHSFVFEGAAQMYDGANRPEHDMLTCEEPGHAGCHIRAFIVGVRVRLAHDVIEINRALADAVNERAQKETLRADLWNVAGCIVAACESQQEHIASVACMEGSPLVDMAREVVRRHNLSNDTTSAVGLNATADFAGSNATRTVDGRTRDLNSTPLTASAEVVSPQPLAGPLGNLLPEAMRQLDLIMFSPMGGCRICGQQVLGDQGPHGSSFNHATNPPCAYLKLKRDVETLARIGGEEPTPEWLIEKRKERAEVVSQPPQEE